MAMEEIARAHDRGGRVLIADALLNGDASRNGWSFIVHPRPSAHELAPYSRPLSSDRIAFVAADEKIWLGL